MVHPTAASFGPDEKLNNFRFLEGSDVGPGGAEAESQSLSDDPRIEEPRCWRKVAIRLAPMLVIGSIPFVILFLTGKNSVRHYVSPDSLAIFGGAWAIFAIWVTLDKGLGGLLARNRTEIAWSLIGLTNLIGVLFFFARLREL